jgi:DNA-binding CsgD family transcriptional regulator
MEENMSTIETVGNVGVGKDLTRRERVVLANLSEEATLEQIASKLFVTRNTVKSQVRSVYRKIGVSTRADAVKWARAAGIQDVTEA